MSVKYILFDTETTGADEEDKIIQIGAMVVDQSGSIEVYDSLCKTDIPIKIEAVEVNNITPDIIENKPKYIELPFKHVLDQLNTMDNFLIAHNINFDLDMIKKEGFVPNINLIDTLRCSKHLVKGVNSHRLQHLRYALELYKKEKEEAKKNDITIKAHDAIGDVLIMKLLLSHLVKVSKEVYPNEDPILKLVELTKQPVLIETFSFGKHKDKLISDICVSDRGYITWMKNNMDLDEDMLYTLDYYK